MRPIEDNAFVPNAEHKLIFSTRLDLTDVLDKFDGLAPTQIVGELAVEEILAQRFQVLAHNLKYRVDLLRNGMLPKFAKQETELVRKVVIKLLQF